MGRGRIPVVYAFSASVGTITSLVYNGATDKAYLLSTLGVSVFDAATGAVTSTNPVTIPGVTYDDVTTASINVGGSSNNLIAFGIKNEAVLFDISSSLTYVTRAILGGQDRYTTSLQFIGTNKDTLVGVFSTLRVKEPPTSSPQGVVSLVSVTNTCPTGQSYSASRNACVSCPVGSYDEDLKECIACPAGYYGVKVGGITSATVCKPCGRGTFSYAGSSSCLPCSAGTYNDQIAAQSCTVCPEFVYWFWCIRGGGETDTVTDRSSREI